VSEFTHQVFQLPSKAEAYEDRIPPTVKVRPWLSGDHRYMAASGDSVELYKHILEKVLVSPQNLDYNLLLVGDVVALVVMVRILSEGPDYTAKFDCAECEEKQQVLLKLNDLMTRSADDEEFIELGGFKAVGIEVEVGGHKYVCHLSTLADEETVQKVLQAQRKKGNVGNESVDRAYLRLAQMIDTIDGKELKLMAKLEHVDRLTMDDHEELLRQLNRFDIGILPTQTVKCKICKEENKARMEFDAEFFRPQSRRKGGE